MSNGRSQPPTLGMFLLRHLCPKDNREILIGDLLESFREGRSDGWFWRQVLIALLAGVSKGLRLHWPEICFAVAGTFVIPLEWWICGSPRSRDSGLEASSCNGHGALHMTLALEPPLRR
jgi:hypothetical protein